MLIGGVWFSRFVLSITGWAEGVSAALSCCCLRKVLGFFKLLVSGWRCRFVEGFFFLRERDSKCPKSYLR